MSTKKKSSPKYKPAKTPSLPKVETTSNRSYGYPRYRTSPGVTQELRQKVKSFSFTDKLYTKGDSETFYVQKTEELNVKGGDKGAVVKRYQAVVDLLTGDNDVTIINLGQGRNYYGGGNPQGTLAIVYYRPATDAEIARFETEKAKVATLTAEVEAAKEKYKAEQRVENEKRRAEQKARNAKARAEQKAREAAAKKVREAEEKAEAETQTVAHAIKVLKEAGVKVQIITPAPQPVEAKKAVASIK